MSYELVNRITVKKDGVYLSSHSNNDNDTFRSRKVKKLSEAYNAGGQSELDKAVIRMTYESIELKGPHPSVIAYLNAIQKAEDTGIWNEYTKAIRSQYNLLSTTDIDSEYAESETPAMKKLHIIEEEQLAIYCEKVAALVVHPTKKKG